MTKRHFASTAEEITWRDIFEQAEIENDVLLKEIMESDDGHALECFLGGAYWAKNFVSKVIVEPTMYARVLSSAIRIGEGNPRRYRIEHNLSTPSDFGKSRRSKDFLYDNRESHHSLHVGLQVEAFGHFINVEAGSMEIDSKYYRVASSLMMAMSKNYANESARLAKFAIEVENILPPIRSVAVNHCSSDGTILVKGRPVVNFLFKNEFAGVTSDPVRQNIGCFMNLKKGEVGRSPMLLVSVVGPYYMQVNGAVWNGSNVCIDPLCRPVSLLYVQRDVQHGVSAVARVLAAIVKTIEELEQYYGNLYAYGIDGPYFMCDKGLKFGETFGDRDWLFQACWHSKTVCVKFVRKQYGIKVHKLLASHNLAPDLLHYQDLPGGWVAIIMEIVDGQCIDMTTEMKEETKHSLKEVEKLLQGNNFVHGDLRPQNIIENEKTVKIIDFDWAGECGIVRYPPELIGNQDWHPDVQPGACILREHDVFQLRKFYNLLPTS